MIQLSIHQRRSATDDAPPYPGLQFPAFLALPYSSVKTPLAPARTALGSQQDHLANQANLYIEPRYISRTGAFERHLGGWARQDDDQVAQLPARRMSAVARLRL